MSKEPPELPHTPPAPHCNPPPSPKQWLLDQAVEWAFKHGDMRTRAGRAKAYWVSAAFNTAAKYAAKAGWIATKSTREAGVPPTNEDHQLVRDAARAYALCYRDVHGHWPLVLHQERYRYFGDTVEIIEAHVYGNPGEAEVTIRKRFGEHARVEFSELTWQD